MVRTRRESHHHDGITDPKDLQLPFATKSAQSGHPTVARQCPLLREEADITHDESADKKWSPSPPLGVVALARQFAHF